MNVKYLTIIISSMLSFASHSQNDLRFNELVACIKQVESPMVLQQEDARVLVSSNQAQVITSSTAVNGYCYGWLDEATLKKNKTEKTRLFYGGEDRFWLNPLGSRFSLYYGQKKIQQENWKVPDLFVKAIFPKVEQSKTKVTFKKENVEVVNNIGTTFNIDIERQITLYTKREINKILQITIPEEIKSVGFGSETMIINRGVSWEEKKGLITPWAIGMFKGTTTAVGIFPFSGNATSLDLSTYFFNTEKDRVRIKDSVVYFKTDGEKRSKIGLPREHSKPVIGYYDYENHRLTIIKYSLDKKGKYLSSDEEHLEDPYHGDAVNSYNNASDANGSTFFELETTAPAKALKTNESVSHLHQTFHFEGEELFLNEISKTILGCELMGLNNVLNSGK
ncbi:DUF6786 family protein [Aquimarina algiphila]|uniref:DUF6786 family protein n=1 Tax=Aquimarina algiphila TaxID=2047982 RepID=UPI00249335AA|nr:DUF6786 family protein [Aquimarina algiphila]